MTWCSSPINFEHLPLLTSVQPHITDVIAVIKRTSTSPCRASRADQEATPCDIRFRGAFSTSRTVIQPNILSTYRQLPDECLPVLAREKTVDVHLSVGPPGLRTSSVSLLHVQLGEHAPLIEICTVLRHVQFIEKSPTNDTHIRQDRAHSQMLEGTPHHLSNSVRRPCLCVSRRKY